MRAAPITRYRLTDHARTEMARRQIGESAGEPPQTYLLRVFVDIDEPPEVVTVYRTGKIEKYWKAGL